MNMDDFDEIYVRREIQRALSGHPAEDPLTLKIDGAEAGTRWLNVSTKQVRAIRELIASDAPDLDAVAAILAEED
jgi:hypothetical protein